MGLEDYIRARSDQYYAPNPRDVRIHSPQQQKAAIIDKSIAGNGVPASRFMRPLIPFQYPEAEFNNQQSQQYDLPVTTAQQQQQPEKSIFDTDVENADDTTITLTSLADIEARDRDHDRRGMFDHDISQDWDGSVLSESDHLTDRNDNYYRTEEPVKTPAKAPRYRRKTVVPLAETEDINYANGYRDNDHPQTLDWNPAEIPRSATATSNKRNSITNVSRIPRAKSRMSLQRSDSDPGLRSARMASTKEAATATNTRTVQIPYRTGYSKASNFPQNLATTPNNRFNFKSERSYERLISQQASPTRQVSGPRPQPESRQERQRHQQQRRVSSASPQKSGRTRQKPVATPSNKVRRLLDETDDSFDDGTEEEETQEISEDIDDESSSSSVHAQSLTTTDITERKRSVLSTSSESIDKRYQKLASDYPDEVLQHMDYSELEKEPFDHSPGSSSPFKHQRATATATTTPKKTRAPSPPPLPPPALPPPPPDTSTSPSEKLAYIMNALTTPTARHKYISGMPITDWELLGDELIDQMGEMLKMIKDSRQARRRTTALFEAEIRRRHDQTINEAGELDRKFVEMKEGGLGVLRALNP